MSLLKFPSHATKLQVRSVLNLLYKKERKYLDLTDEKILLIADMLDTTYRIERRDICYRVTRDAQRPEMNIEMDVKHYQDAAKWCEDDMRERLTKLRDIITEVLNENDQRITDKSKKMANKYEKNGDRKCNHRDGEDHPTTQMDYCRV